MHKGTMRRGLLALVGLAGAAMVSGAAMAADISRPVYKAPPAGALPVAYDWTGFYVGGHVGYGWADKDWRDAFGLVTTHSADGFLGGGQAGFNYQINQFVLGVEGDVSWANLKGDSTQVFGRGAGHAELQLRGRLDRNAHRPRRHRVRPLAGLRQGRRRLVRRPLFDQPLHLPALDRDQRHARGLDRGRRRRVRLRAAMVGQARVQLHGLRHAHLFVRAGNHDRHRSADPCGQARRELQVRRRPDQGRY